MVVEPSASILSIGMAVIGVAGPGEHALDILQRVRIA
jgi:hypothetical protein